MNVRNLIQILERMPQDAIVMMEDEDRFGNTVSGLCNPPGHERKSFVKREDGSDDGYVDYCIFR